MDAFNNIDIGDALLSLEPDSVFIIRGEEIEWLNKDVTQPTKAAIDAEVKRLQTEYTSQAYARNRKESYPEIGDQLDDLYHAGAFSTDMAAKLKKVKDDNPKG